MELYDSDLCVLASQNLAAYGCMTDPSFIYDSYHITQMLLYLEDLEARRIKRLIITMPPRHGKSTALHQVFTPWYLGRNPKHSIITATYGQELADDFGRKVRDICMSKRHRDIFPGFYIRNDSKSAHRFMTGKGGVFYAVGVGGPTTGRGANLMIIDDPIKDRAEAESSTIRKRIQEWFSSVVRTRIEPDGVCVITHTRWHEDDLIGYVLREALHEDWHIVNFPAILTHDGNESALWPERFPLDTLKSIRQTLSQRDWSALYMQSPIAIGGNVFKREHMLFYDNRTGQGMNKYMLVDPANSKRPDSDYTVIWVIGANNDGNLYVLDLVRDRLNVAEREKMIFEMHRKWKPLLVAYEQYGMQLDAEWLKHSMNTYNYRFRLESVGGSMKKEDRIMRLLPYFEEGRILFPHKLHKTMSDGITYDLIQQFVEEELLNFPASRHDDMLDALSRILDIDIKYPSNQNIDYYALYGYNK